MYNCDYIIRKRIICKKNESRMYEKRRKKRENEVEVQAMSGTSRLPTECR